MRVITGIARGRKLVTLEGEEVVRPTTDRVKEAMFSIIQFDIPGKSVLDLLRGRVSSELRLFHAVPKRLCLLIKAQRLFPLLSKTLKPAVYLIKQRL